MNQATGPGQPRQVRQVTAEQLKSMLGGEAPPLLIDVRTEAERRIARIEGAQPLNPETREMLEGMERDTLLVFHCHHGIRSQAAAQQFLAQGFTNVCNLVGGIDAWSLAVDPTVPRY